MTGARAAVFLRCFLRSYLVTSAYNPHGLQNIGFLYAIEPGLYAIHGPGQRLREARLRYARRYNTHPFLTPLFLGMLLRMEKGIAAGHVDPAVVENLKDTTANTLSAIGDSIFSGTLLSTWALTMGCLVLAGAPGLGLALTVAAFVLLQAFKLATFIMGFRNGMSALFFVRRLDPINWGGRIKVVNALLLTLFLWQALPEASMEAWAGTILYLFMAGWIVGRLHVPRIFLAILLLVITASLHMSGLFGRIPALLSSL